MQLRPKPILMVPVLCIILTGCKRQAPSAVVKPPPGVDYNVGAPTSKLGVNLQNVSNLLTVNLYVLAQQDVPKVIVGLDGANPTEIQLSQNSDGNKTHPLLDVLKNFRNAHRDESQVIVNAPSEMKYAQIQAILLECAQAGIIHVDFATKGSTESKTGTHFLPYDMPVQHADPQNPSHAETPILSQKQFEVFIVSTGGAEMLVEFSSGHQFKKGLDSSGKTLAQVLEEEREKIEATGEPPDNLILIIAPKLATRYDQVIAVYEDAIVAKWPHVGFKDANR